MWTLCIGDFVAVSDRTGLSKLWSTRGLTHIVLACHHASNHRSSRKLAHPCWCLWASTSMPCIPSSNMVRHGTCQHNYAVQRGLVIGFCGQPLYCNWPHYLTTRFWSPSSHMVSAQLSTDRPRTMLCKSAEMESCPITFLWLWPATDHEPHSQHVPTNNIWRATGTTSQSGWRINMAGINSDHSTRRIKGTWCKTASLHASLNYWQI